MYLGRNKRQLFVTSFFTHSEEVTKAFIRALPEQEVINAVIGNVKLAGAGLLKLEQKAKAEKKEKRKEQDKKKDK